MEAISGLSSTFWLDNSTRLYVVSTPRELVIFNSCYNSTSVLLLLHLLLRHRGEVIEAFPHLFAFAVLTLLVDFLFYVSGLTYVLGETFGYNMNYLDPVTVPLMLTSSFMVMWLPSVPYSITMVHSILLNFKIKHGSHFWGIPVTKLKLIISACLLLIALDGARYSSRIKTILNTPINHSNTLEKWTYLSFILKDGRVLKFDLLRFIPTMITCREFLKKIRNLKEHKESWNDFDLPSLVYISLYLLVFTTTTIVYTSGIVLGYLSEDRKVCIVGFQDSQILKYVFVYATYLVLWIKSPDEKSKKVSSVVLPINQ